MADFGELEDEAALAEEDAQPQEADPQLEADGDLPEWLSDDSEVEAESATPATDQNDLPDWLAGFDEPEDEATLVGATAQPQEADPQLAADGDLPEWLSDDSEVEPEGATPATDQDDLPAWLADKAGDIALAAGIAKVVDASSEKPDLVKDSGDGDEVNATDERLLRLRFRIGSPIWMGKRVMLIPSIEENLPDWLSDIEGIEEIPESEEDLPRSAVDESRAVPDWLRDSEVSLPAVDDVVEAEPTEAHPFEADDDIDDDLFEMDQLADWISEESQSEIDQTARENGPSRWYRACRITRMAGGNETR